MAAFPSIPIAGILIHAIATTVVKMMKP
jgi:hypothetical protein